MHDTTVRKHAEQGAESLEAVRRADVGRPEVVRSVIVSTRNM
jgi:hypothetical protein